MDQINTECFRQSLQAPNQFAPSSIPLQSGSGVEKDNSSARKTQKAGREKLRRDRLNEQFLELGKVLDPDRPKNDKGTILTDTIQVVTGLTAQVTRLKAEFATLTDESRELTQEKNDLREEKAVLKSDIESLNSQYQQRLRATYPWGTIDHSMVMHPPQYPMPIPFQMPIPNVPIPMPMPNMQPFPFFGAQAHGVISNPCSNFVPYVNNNPVIEQQSVQQGAKRHVSTKKGARDEMSNCEGEIDGEKGEASNDVMTELELKTPGSARKEDSTSPQRKIRKVTRRENELADGSSSSSRCCSSSRSVQNSSSSSVVGGGNAED